MREMEQSALTNVINQKLLARLLETKNTCGRQSVSVGDCPPFLRSISKKDPSWYGPAQVLRIERGSAFLLYCGRVLTAPLHLVKACNPESAPTELLDRAGLRGHNQTGDGESE